MFTRSTLLLLALFSCLFLPALVFAAQDSPSPDELKEKAAHAYIAGHFKDAAALDQEIAEQHPESEAAHYAVQMLGTLYENNIVDIKKAIKWDREFMDKYADSRQVPFYKDKLASLEKLAQQEDTFRAYQKIEFSGQGDELKVEQFEAFLKDHPDFILKDKVRTELAYAYGRLDKRKRSYLEFQALTKNGQKKLSTTDQLAFDDASLYWEESSVLRWVAWGVVALLWIAVLLAKPWKQVGRSSVKTFLIFAILWILLIASVMPYFYSMETAGYPIVIPDTVVYTAAGLNLTILIWLSLMIKMKFWQNRPRLLLWCSPVLTLLMTAAVFYILLVHQPNGPYTMDVFCDQYQHWANGGK